MHLGSRRQQMVPVDGHAFGFAKGESIISGLNLDDHILILEGAVPTALLALLVQGCFGLLDRLLIPRGLRLNFGSG